MTTWIDVKTYIRGTYKAEEINEGLLKFLFNTGNLRSQLAFIAHETAEDGVEWVRVSSPVDSVQEVNLVAVGRVLSTKIVGGLIVIDDTVYITNCVPLINLDANELDEPLQRIAGIADEVEAAFVGSDRF